MGQNNEKTTVVVRRRHDIQADCIDWALEIGKSYQPDLILFIAKSGFVFAMPLARVFGCDVADVLVKRQGNGIKDAISNHVPHIPLSLLKIVLKSRLMICFNSTNNKRELVVTDRLRSINLDKYHKILLVDDSVDTGWSMRKALDYLDETVPNSEKRIASYSVIDASKKRVKVDYPRYNNLIAITATSRFSPEHERFISDYERWSRGEDVWM